jgi:hypothetical protein
MTGAAKRSEHDSLTRGDRSDKKRVFPARDAKRRLDDRLGLLTRLGNLPIRNSEDPQHDQVQQQKG